MAPLAKNLWEAGQLEALHNAAPSPNASASSIKAWQEVSAAVQAPAEAKAAELAGFSGDFQSARAARINMLRLFYVVLLPTDMLPETLGQMLVGMALFKRSYGFGLYGQLSRVELLWVVVGIWAAILLWSPAWMARFHYGPFEWAWRSLVQWKPQKFRKAT